MSITHIFFIAKHIAPEETNMQLQYLEIVTPDVDETCSVLAAQHGAQFSDQIPELGFARIASLSGGGRIGVRAPMRDDEEPVVRPYTLVDDIEAASAAAEAAGGSRHAQSLRPSTFRPRRA